jgi:hypothetical protein
LHEDFLQKNGIGVPEIKPYLEESIFLKPEDQITLKTFKCSQFKGKLNKKMENISKQISLILASKFYSSYE